MSGAGRRSPGALSPAAAGSGARSLCPADRCKTGPAIPTGLTLFDKIWNRHVVTLGPGGRTLLSIATCRSRRGRARGDDRALWSQERASFQGRFVAFQDVCCGPLPPERRIPLIVGGDTRAAARRAGRLGDGYFPARPAPAELLDEMRRAAEEAGRNPADIQLTVAAPPEPAEIEKQARQSVARVAVPVSSAAGLPAQVRTPDDVLRYGKEMIARFR
ncbi:MAG: LLM class flavin-dependent oxidoreductase [Candidatus Rokubacteria bacterium]|nr:LLM class flavin-dependent oxidoreductase [Candidatus Rokubacteria bacterium]